MTEKILVQIEGTTPLLFNRFRDTQIEGKSKKRTGAMVEADIEDKLAELQNCQNKKWKLRNKKR